MFGNYGPYGFSGHFGAPFNGPINQQSAQQGLFGQPMPQPSPAPSAQQTGPDWLQVPELRQVEQIQVQPGGKAWVMVQNEPIFALRVADQMGLVTTSYYRFEKIDPVAMSASAPSQEYVTRAEFQRFVESLRAPILDQPAATELVETQTKKEAFKK